MFRFSKKLKILSAAASYAGSRMRNEDSVLSVETTGRYCFVVADGLGGHGFGDVASKIMTETFLREFKTVNFPGVDNPDDDYDSDNHRHDEPIIDNCVFLGRAFNSAQKEILAAQKGKRPGRQMKTTAVALSVINGKCAWGHLGDTRLYRFNNGKLAGRTLDHSVPQMLVYAKELKESEIAKHPDRSRLLCAFGDNWDTPRYEISKNIPLKKGTAFLLCTDGVWEHFPGGQPPPPIYDDAASWLSEIISAAKTAEQQSEDIDNYSAVTIVVQ